MAFGFFAHGKHLQGFSGVLGGGGHANGERDGVGPERHATDGMDGEVFGVDFGAHGMPTDIADEVGAKWIESGHSAIDVEIALFAGGEGKGAGADGFFEQEFFEGGGGWEHGVSMQKRGGAGKSGSVRVMRKSSAMMRCSTAEGWLQPCAVGAADSFDAVDAERERGRALD